MSDDWRTQDPFSDPDDPAARERAERRAERERKRQAKAEKRGGPPPQPAEPAKPATPPAPKRSAEQEFWDEDPTPPPVPAKPAAPAASSAAAGAAAGSGAAASAGAGAEGDQAKPPKAEKRRRGFLRRRKDADETPPASAPPTEEKAPPAAPDRSAAAKDDAPTDKSPATKENAFAGKAAAMKEDASAHKLAAASEGVAPSKAGDDPVAPADKPSVPGGAPPAPADAPARPDQPAAAGPAATDKLLASAAPAAPQEPSPPATKSRALPDPSEPTREQPLPPPVPAPDDPTQAATGDHLIPDPDAPNADALAPVAAGAATAAAGAAEGHGSGQTSEEWATVPSAEGDWEDFAADEYHDDGHPEMAGAARTGRRRNEDGGGRRGGILGAILGHPFRIAALILLLVVLWFLNSLFQPFHGDGHGRVAVRIPKGASVSEIGDLLEKRGVIGGSTFGVIGGSTLFQIRTTIAGKRSELISGRHTLQEDMSYDDAITALTKEQAAKKAPAGGPKTVTIPEGYTRGQAAPIIREDGVKGNYKKATVKSKYLDPAEYGGKKAKNLEGFLFPDTFELKAKAPVKGLVQLQLQDFKRRIKQVNMKFAKSKNLTVYDVVTIASMIEREAGVAKQRKLVSSVIYNRLHEGIPLGIDATIRFATGNYEKPLTESELATDSPYNTRLNAGLPPGPINSPGLAALQAAAHPAKTDFIYYVNDPDSCNELTFTKTNEEFEAAVQKYENAREANGGNAPSTCGE